jgi:lysyl-tRNA synthetase class 1
LNTEEFIENTLRNYGYLQKNQHIDDGLRKRIDYAFNWVHDFEEIKETRVSLTKEEQKAVSDLIATLETVDDPEKIQNAIFNTAKNNGLKPGAFFRTLYGVLMGAPQGPRLGPYILAMGKENVVAALKRALGKK